MACSSGCTYQDCDTYGTCLRRKGIQVDRHALANDTRGETRHTRALLDYQELRANGSMPTSPRWDHVEHAKKEATKHGIFRDDS